MKGIALILTLLVMATCSALTAGLILVTMPERMADTSYRDSVTALNAADAALQLTARELGGLADWNTVLAGMTQSAYADGVPSGVRRISGGDDIDLTERTNALTCGRPTTCSDAQVRTQTAERPWGSNNPRWRLYLYTPLDAVIAVREFVGVYVVVWVGDDSNEADDNPTVDGGAASRAGAGIVRVRAESFGPGVTHRAIEAEIVRRDGSRVQSWRTVTPGVP